MTGVSTSYIDIAGKPITALEWAKRFENYTYRTIATSKVRDALIRTMWLGVNEPEHHMWPFGTAVFCPHELVSDEVATYRTAGEAVAGHYEIAQAAVTQTDWPPPCRHPEE